MMLVVQEVREGALVMEEEEVPIVLLDVEVVQLVWLVTMVEVVMAVQLVQKDAPEGQMLMLLLLLLEAKKVGLMVEAVVAMHVLLGE